MLCCTGPGQGLVVATSSKGGRNADGQPETPAVAAQATENEQVSTSPGTCPYTADCSASNRLVLQFCYFKE